MTCAGVVEAIDFSWPVDVPSVVWTARISEFSTHPANGLTGQLLHIGTSAITDQLRERGCKQLGGSAFGLCFQSMPLPVIDAESAMKIPCCFKGFFRPVRTLNPHCSLGEGD